MLTIHMDQDKFSSRVTARTCLQGWEEPTCTSLSAVVRNARTARMLLSMIAEPDDTVTGRLFASWGRSRADRCVYTPPETPHSQGGLPTAWR